MLDSHLGLEKFGSSFDGLSYYGKGECPSIVSSSRRARTGLREDKEESVSLNVLG